MSTDFLTLPAELRQAILIESYNATTYDVFDKVIDHIPKIEAWRQTLHNVYSDIEIWKDIEYAHRQWLKDLENLANKEWYLLFPDERNVIFRATRGGLSPWIWVHRHLSSLNMPEIYNIKNQPYEYKRWGKGPSTITWDSCGYKHPPSTWGCTVKVHDDGFNEACCQHCTFGLWDFAIDDVGYTRDVYDGAKKRDLFLPLCAQREFRRSPGSDAWREVALSDDTDEGWQLVMSRKAGKLRNQVRAVVRSVKEGRVLI